MKKYLILILLLISTYGNSLHAQKINVLLAPTYDEGILVLMKTTARMTLTVHKLFGDSIIEECIKDKSWCFISISLNPNGYLTDCHVRSNQQEKNKRLAKFIDSHKYSIINEYIQTYRYIYSCYIPKFLFYSLSNIARSGYYFWFSIPYTGHTGIDIIMEDTVDGFLEKIAKYEYCPIKTSIDEGIMPESYFWYIKEFQKIYGIENQSY